MRVSGSTSYTQLPHLQITSDPLPSAVRTPGMSLRHALGIVAVAMAAGACGSTASTTHGAASVQISNFAFQPAAPTLHTGERITFTNRDSTAHTATSGGGPGSFDTGTLKPGQSRTITLTRPGTYSYYCQFHAFMRGTIRVAG